MIIRPAHAADAEAMCGVLNPIIRAGGTTAHRTPFEPERMRAHYIDHPARISCFVAETAGGLLGFQSLAWSEGQYDLPEDWGVIATFVAIGAIQAGTGRALFAETRAAARQAGVAAIDATIRRENTGGQIFYGKLGFTDWRDGGQTVSKRIAP